MNKRNVILSIVSIILTIILMIIPNKTKAAELNQLTTPLYFGIIEFREGTTPENMGYAINNPSDNGNTANAGANIWQIVKYNNGQGTGNYITGNYYCVRAGVGFSSIRDILSYTNYYDLKNDKEIIKNSSNINKYVKDIVNNQYYNNLLAISDLLYLQGVSTNDDKKNLLDAAKIYTTDYYSAEDADWSVTLTDSDIDAVQQAAIWYYTNYDNEIYDNYKKDSWLFYNTDKGNGYNSLSGYAQATTKDGYQRHEQAKLLYNYLIDTANKNASLYANGNVNSRTKITLYTNNTVQNTQPIILIERTPEVKKDGSYNVNLIKQDQNGKQLNSRATFEVNGEIKNVTGKLEIASNVAITEENVSKADVYTIKETVAPDKYCKFEGTIVVTVTKKYQDGEYVVDNISHKVTDANGKDITTQSKNDVKVSLKDGNIYVEVKNYQNDGSYNVTLIKEDKSGEQLDSKATFEVNGEIKEVIGRLEIAKNVEITPENVTRADVYTIKETVAPDEYCKFDGTITVTVTKKNENGNYKVDNMSYKVTDASGKDITTLSKDDVKVYLRDGNIYVEVKNYQNDGSYNVTLVKEDKNGEQLNSKATFEVNGQTKEVTGRLDIAKDVAITAENVSRADIYTIKETVAPDEYCKFDGTITVTVTKKNENGNYKVDNMSYKVTDATGKDITEASKKDVNVYLNENGNIYVEVKNYQFDLKLVKRIVEVNSVKVPERIEDIDISKLADRTETTAKYDLNKEPVAVKKGDIVKYTLRVYNEGDIDGYASELTEDVPEGLEYLWSEKVDDELEQDTTLTKEEKDAIKYNQGIWDIETINTSTSRVELIKTDYLAKGKGDEIASEGANLIKAFDSSKEYKNTINDKNPDYKEVSVYMKVVSDDVTGTIIRNEAAITEDTDGKGNPVDDRDSDTEKWVKYEDDEDYDNIVLQAFDLSLRKFIIAVSKDDNIEESEYLKNSDGKYKREPEVDTSKLNTIDENGKLITTAIYNHTKEPIEVIKGDIVVYMLRVYNEGDLDGYASEIKDHLPPYLQYVDSDFNKQYGWEVSEDGRTVTTRHLEDKKISKAEKRITVTEGINYILSYKEVPIMCKVTDDAEGKITNIADITEYKDENKNSINDRDSEENNVILPDDKDLPNYKDEEKADYVPGQQDDDDFEKLIVKKFDLALRKFITDINNKEVTTRIPQIKYDKENNKITYEHTKEPVDVVTSDIVTYTIRVFNEGEVDGFASKITDDIPDGLEYLPNNDLNKEYRWVMYDEEAKETTDVNKAVKITTDYLSKEQGEARMKQDEDDTEVKENPALLTAFDTEREISETNPDYADVKVAFKVIEPNGSDKILVNSAQISEDTDKDGNPIDDIDSTPDEWIEGEDDQDKEYVKLTYFDLALRKWVTHAIVIENGKETVTQTGHKPEDDPEQVVKVELHRKKLNSVTVKFKYSIRITNEGDIAGYAKEITDYVPEGLKFVASDNEGWTDEGNNVISTRKLENTLLQPGESADVEVVLTWINNKDNMGLKVNVAEISEDYNDKHVPDRDSTPDNKVPGEDDIDDAPVLLAVSTGQARIYFTLGFAVLMTLASGIVLIKKFIL